MTRNIYKMAADLFQKILELPESDRAAVLEDRCAGDDELRAKVERLLAADEQLSSEAFLERPALHDAAKLISPVPGNLPSEGTVLGNYRLLKRIGEGGMGIVYQAEDLRLARRVAVKILIPPSSLEGQERIRRFQREARAAGQLNHPHIAAIFDAGLDHDFYFIAMEFVEGRTLRALIAESRFIDSKTVLELVSQTASALSAAHAAGIIHRDIKPENIMIRPDGYVKVLDFGLAAVRDAPPEGGPNLHTKPGHLAGTAHYLSPEQVLGEPATPRSDLFSLGVVAYELATGVRPFDGLSDGAIFDAILHRDPPPPSALRLGLGQELDSLVMGALEKDPELRFQNASDIRSYCRRLTRGSISTPVGLERAGVAAAITRRSGRKMGLWPLAAAGLCLVFAVLFWLSRPLPEPRVTHITQITHDGLPKDYFVNDGSRLYYAAGSRDPGIRMFEVSAKGGEPVPMPALAGMFPLDISADGSEMLLGRYGDDMLSVAPTLGGPPRRIGDLKSGNAQWSPKGDEILYRNGTELRIARSDGSESRVLARVGGYVHYPAWSPDGRSIRFTSDAKNSLALWEVAADGTHLHELFPASRDVPREQGVWTPDGRYFVFSADQPTPDIWVMRESPRFSLHRRSNPVRLTNGPLMADHPQPSPDGRKIFFRGRLDRGELVRYDRKLDQWTPYLQGLAATQLDYSRDGRWITYVSYPEGVVWRSALDGNHRLQLTTSPLFARNPRFSPDGKQIVFYGAKPGQPDRLYLVPTIGGTVRQLTRGVTGPGGDDDGSWSADGNSIVFCAQFNKLASEQLGLALGIIDVKSGRSAKLPGSDGLWSARWSPNGQYIAGLEYSQKSIWLYSLATHQRRQLTTMAASWPSWSPDNRYIQFVSNAVLYRVRISDGKVERVLSLSTLKTAEESLGWVGVTPDGSPISTRDAGSTEIYALDWEAP